jgi:8-oxo-dGTP pyrophosphatase MutT (NUDIX family)
MDCDAAVVLIIRKGKILLIKRKESEKDPWSGHMALPGGRRKKDETCLEAAIRETKEEVGLMPKIVGELGVYSPRRYDNMKVKVYIGELEREEDLKIDYNEVDKAFWIDPSELIEQGESFIYKEYVIWGMTYRILKDYLRSDRQRKDHHFSAVNQSSFT